MLKDISEFDPDANPIVRDNTLRRRRKYQWQLVNDLMRGADAIRANSDYTPLSSKLEEPYTRKQRQYHSYLYNKFRQSAKMFSSRPFKKGINYAEDKKPTDFFKEFSKNVDARQNDLLSFSLNTFETALNKGLAFVVLDKPTVDIPAIRSIRDDMESPIMPYWVLIQPEQVLDFNKNRDGSITSFRYYILHDYIDADLNYKKYYEIRYLHDDILDIYTNEIDEDRFILVETIENPDLKVYCFETDAESAPLGDLADMNLRHWQLNSVLQLSTVYFDYPILVGHNLPENFNIKRDYQTVVHLGEEQDLKFVHPNMPGSATLTRFVQDLEEKMIAFGSRLDSVSGVSQSATEVTYNEAQVLTVLGSYTSKFQIFLNTIIADTLATASQAGEVELLLDVEIYNTQNAVNKADLLLRARLQGDISNQVLIEGFCKLGILPETVTCEANLEQLQSEELKPVSDNLNNDLLNRPNDQRDISFDTSGT